MGYTGNRGIAIPQGYVQFDDYQKDDEQGERGAKDEDGQE